MHADLLGMALPMTESVASDGRLLVGRYRFDKLLGHGGMGWVWAAHDETLGRDVAVKEIVPPPDLTPEQREQIRRRALREARAAARIAHPSAVTVYDVVEEGGQPYIVMQLLPPRTLADVLLEDGPLSPAQAARIGVDLVEALDTAHQAGVLHRDVKPANVMLSESGRAVLTDFGIATVEDDPTLTTTGMLVGSPAYMAPERARGERPTPAADLWSLGATLFAAVEGQPPFRRDGQLPTLNAVLTEQPPPAEHGGPLRPVIAALLHRDSAARPSAPEARDLLLRAAADAEADDTEVLDPGHETVDVPRPYTEPTIVTAVDAEPVAPPGREALPPDAEPVAPPVREAPGARRRAWLAVAAVVVVLVLAGAGLARLLGGGVPGGSAAPSTSAPDAGRTAAPNASGGSGPSAQPTAGAGSGQAADGSGRGSGVSGTSTSGGSSTGGAGSGPGSGRNSGASAVPAGFRRYADPTGFSLVIPTPWTVTRKGSDVTFHSGGRAYLLVPQTTQPAADALVDWQDQERAASPTFPGYQRIRLERVSFHSGWDAADWEFRWTPSGGTLHVLDRNLRVSDRRAYALYWSVPEQDWSRMWRTFIVIADSFRPAP